MSEDAPELTAELVVDGVVPSQPVISPTGAGLPTSSLRPQDTEPDVRDMAGRR
jgi:hypothetical protein